LPAKIYDVIVVGTGAGGGTAIKVLCEAGLNVLALNSGPRILPARDYRNHRQPYDLKYRGFGDPHIRAKYQSPWNKRDEHGGEYTEGPRFWEHEVPYTNAPGSNWVWTRCKATGGKANFWGRSSCRFGDIDFKAASLDGFDVDWPMDYGEMAPYFSRAEKYMGVASTVQGRPSNPDGDYLPPLPFRCFNHILQKSAEKMGVPYLPDRCAQLTVAHNGHPACHYCGGCTSGCDTGSFFSPTWFTLPDAEKTGRLELRTDALAKHVLVDESGQANGVAYIDRGTRQEMEVYSRVVVLAASCLETAHIMLNSKSRHWPTGIANSSGQLGRNLCDHLYGGLAEGYLPQLLGQPVRPDNISSATVAWMPRWQNLKHPHEEKFIRGYSIYSDGGCDDDIWQGYAHYTRYKERFGRELKRAIKRYYPAAVDFGLQAPSLPSAGNYVDLDPQVTDPFAVPVLRFHFQWGKNELRMWEHAKQTVAELMKGAGGEIWEVGTEPDPPGTSLHETGVCRFGDDPRKFVTNRWAQCHDVKNLYICDASIFPSPTDKTTTMPIVAFAMRTCDYLLNNFRTGVHKTA
jgi:choline dehydrogenase-like flavoprotein